MKNRIKRETTPPPSPNPGGGGNAAGGSTSPNGHPAYPSISATYWLPPPNPAPYLVPGNYKCTTNRQDMYIFGCLNSLLQPIIYMANSSLWLNTNSFKY